MVDRGSKMVDGEEEKVKRDWGFEIGGWGLRNGSHRNGFTAVTPP
jgi:hypothetical protein